MTALANGRSTIEERLARWLLLADDRIDEPEIPLTHEFLALMLGVRRPGVTVAAQSLERRRINRKKAGIDRDPQPVGTGKAGGRHVRAGRLQLSE